MKSKFEVTEMGPAEAMGHSLLQGSGQGKPEDYGPELNSIIEHHKLTVKNRNHGWGLGHDPVFYPVSKDGLGLYGLDGLGASRGYVVAYLAMLKDPRFFVHYTPTNAGIDMLHYFYHELSKPEYSDEAGRQALIVIKSNIDSVVKSPEPSFTDMIVSQPDLTDKKKLSKQRFFSAATEMEVSDPQLTDEKTADYF